MKRIFSAALALLLVFALAAPALADIAYEPQDSFIRSHISACDYENRRYWTNGAEGCVPVYDKPDGTVQTVLPNELRFYVSHTYEDTWGCIEYDPDDPAGTNRQNLVSGWVQMGEMLAEYDCIAFEADHAGEFRSEERALELPRDETAYAYSYPGSGTVKEALKGEWFSGDTVMLSKLFTDPAGRDWGFLGYWCGHRDLWICLDDPCNGALEPDENRVTLSFAPAADEAGMQAVLDAAPTGLPSAYLYAGIIGVVLIAAAVLIAALRRKRRK